MSGQHSEREAERAGRPADSPRSGTAAPRADNEPASLWRMGALFHVTTRYPRDPQAAKVDRLAGILHNGLVAPGCCEDGSVFSDLRLTVKGTDVPYDRLVFLHRFGPISHIYTMDGPGRFAVFLDPALPVLTPEEMREPWVMLCQDEVYVPGRVAPEAITAVAVHHGDAASVKSELLAEFRRLGVPLYDYGGTVHWHPERTGS